MTRAGRVQSRTTHHVLPHHSSGVLWISASIIRGVIIGFSIAAPVGPIGVLCIRRTLAEGRAYGLVSGLGAASADAFFGTIAALGLTLVANFLADQQTVAAIDRWWLSAVPGRDDVSIETRGSIG